MLLRNEFGPEVPCAQCQRRVRGIRWGELCPDCRMVREVRAGRVAQRIALAATAVVLVALSLTWPPTASRFWLAVAAAGTYLIVRKVAASLLMEYMPRPPVGTPPTEG
jgi:hypothetical protein